MSYVQIEMGGKLRALKFNKMAQLILEEKIEPGNLISGVYGLVYAGLKANCYVKNEEPDFTFEQSCDWVDTLSDETLLKVQAAYQETEAYKKRQAYLAEVEASKKKVLPTAKASRNTKMKALK